MQALMTPQQAADHLALSPRTLEAWRIKGGGPRYVRLTAKAVRYAPADLAAWAEARTVANTAQAITAAVQQ